MRLLGALFLFVVSFTPAPAQPMMQGKPTKEDVQQLARLTKEQTAAKAAYAKRPKDPQVKKRYVSATVRLGTASMTSLALPSNVKYKRALQFYREALKVDPNNREARNNSQMIIRIYKQLGRPIPK